MRCIRLIVTLLVINCAYADELILTDAYNFAALYKSQTPLTMQALKTQYLDKGSKGVSIFTPRRIINADNLLNAINSNRPTYARAVEQCLVNVESLKSEALSTLHKTQTILSQSKAAPVYVVFGANNSGGTASVDGLVLGLEVICSFAETQREFKDVLMNFIAHEITHVYQNRAYAAREQKPQSTLLFVALHEGIADFVAGLVLNTISQAEIQRHTYGLKHEKALWQRFKAQMNATQLSDWFYQLEPSKQPNDMGYWIGKRIAKAYYERANNKEKALNTLINLRDPNRIYNASKYNP
ncbi:MAG: hypothetical protein CL579_05220 [Alteromonadaceae bacterium]|nr:hypothetical protein [Alteromonadaceae bacterium]